MKSKGTQTQLFQLPAKDSIEDTTGEVEGNRTDLTDDCLFSTLTPESVPRALIDLEAEFLFDFIAPPDEEGKTEYPELEVIEIWKK